MNMYEVQSEVTKEISGGLQLKVSVLDLGLYIHGFRALYRGDQLWIQPPSQKTAGGWKKTPEFDTSKQLWQEIEASVRETVSLYMKIPRDTIPSADEVDNFDPEIAFKDFPA